jgi:hypothetical protein
LPFVRGSMTNWAVTVALLAVFQTPGAQRIDPKHVASDIQVKGAEKVLDWLHARPHRIVAVLTGIASGDRAWLTVGRDLFAGAQAGWAYEISLAFGEALPRSAGSVLELAPELSVACGSLDDPFSETLDKALAEVSKREQSVRTVIDPALTKQKACCLEALAQLRAALPNAYRK